MNFLAGFLYLALEQDEGYAFAVLKSIIERFHLTKLYNTEMPMMKLMFY